jgi:nucleotide-binding universal stress UspA family protein
MTTHGHSGLERLWLGSVADQLIRMSNVPVLLLRPTPENAQGSQLASLQRVLIPLDGSAAAEEILPVAQALGRLFVAELALLRVRAKTRAAAADGDPDAEDAQAYLDRTARSLMGQHGKVSARIVTSDQTATAILAAAQEQPHTLIAMTTRGQSGLQRLVLGSVADKVLRGSEGPVLIYRPKGVA